MNQGWIKLWRKISQSLIWQDDALYKAWSACLLLANHEGKDVLISGQIVHLEPGQFITGREAFHAFCYPKKSASNPSSKTLWRRLLILDSVQNLSIKSSNKFSVISVINWVIYQSGTNEIGQQNVPNLSNRCPTDVQQMSTNKKEEKKENEKKKDSPAKPKAQPKLPTYAPDLFPVTDKMRAYAKAKGYHGNLEDLTEKFLIYHRAKGNKWADWYAAWQNWLRNQIEYAKRDNPTPPPRGPDPLDAKMAQWEKESMSEEEARNLLTSLEKAKHA